MTSSSAPLVTVVIPSYNYGRFIAETLASVVAQTYEHWECVVVDDGSTDDTRDVVTVLSAKESRIRYIRQDNQGLAAARNTGIKHATGKYFQFLDADDLLEPRKLECHVEFLEEHPRVDIVFGDVRYFRTDNPAERLFSPHAENEPWVNKLSAEGNEVLIQLLHNNIMVVSSPVLRRSVIEDVGPFEASVRGIEDWHYWVRCANAGKRFQYEDSEATRTLVRIHPTSMSTNTRMMIRSTLLLHRKVAEMVTDSAILQVNRDRMVERTGLLGVEEVAAGRLLPGMWQLCRAAIQNRNVRHTAKWLFCAASAPFVSSERLRGMVTTPVNHLLRKKA